MSLALLELGLVLIAGTFAAVSWWLWHRREPQGRVISGGGPR